MNRSNQKGIALLALIGIILAAIGVLLLGSLFWSAAENSLANRCQNNLGVLQQHYNQWALACVEGDTNTQRTHLNSMNNIVTQWNAGECSKYGALPAQSATCPPRP